MALALPLALTLALALTLLALALLALALLTLALLTLALLALALLTLALLALALLALALLALALLTLALLALALLALALLALALLTLALLTLALLALLALTLLTLLALALLTLLAHLLVHLIVQRGHAAHEVARLACVARLQALALLRLVGRVGRRRDALLEPVEIRPDLVLDRLRALRRACHRLLRVVDLFLDHLLADRAGGFLQLARRVALVVRDAPAGRDCRAAARARRRRCAARPSAAPAAAAARSRCRPAACCGRGCTPLGDVALLLRELAPPRCSASFAVLPARCAAWFCWSRLLRFLQLLRRLLRLRAAVAAAVGRRLAHRVRRLLQPPRGVGQILALLTLPLGFAPQLLELPRRLLDFVGQRALPGAAARPPCCPRACRCCSRLLQLPPRQLLQLVGQLVDLLCCCSLCCCCARCCVSY